MQVEWNLYINLKIWQYWSEPLNTSTENKAGGVGEVYSL